MKTYRIGVVGTAHMHVLHLVDTFVQEGAAFVGCCDLPPAVPTITNQRANRHQNLKEVAQKTGAPVLDSIDEVLAEKPDLVIVCCENARHAEICCRILERGIHVLVEKPMAQTMEQALSMAEAANRNSAKLIVNWPSTWMPAIRTAQRLIAEGAIGKPFRFHYRNYSSLGPFSYGQTLTDEEKAAEWWHQAEAGGGATMDYCCYGACLACWYLGGAPEAAYGVHDNFAHQFASADDYGTITAQFADAVAIVEGSWTTLHPGVSNGPVVSGLAGTLVADAHENTVRLFTKYHSDEPPVVVPCDPYPGGRDTIAKEVLHHLNTGDPLHATLDLPVNLNAMRMLDAGIRSFASKKMEDVR